MQTILDLDIDVFSSPTVYWPPPGFRPSDGRYVCAAVEDVRHFLEQQCGLSKIRKIPGLELVDHDEAFYTWRRWIQEGSLVPPFSIVHVDAHPDMGMGDAGYLYLLSDLLSLPVQHRREPRRGFDALNAGNYLMFAVANRWVEQLTYVFPLGDPWAANWSSGFSGTVQEDSSIDGAPSDLMAIHFRNEDWRTGLLELKHFARETLNQWCVGRKLEPVIRLEPPVPFAFTSVRDFKFHGFARMVVAQSPRFVPPAADKLLPIIRQYFVTS